MISNLEDFKTYNVAMEIGEEVWDVVMRWKFFEKDTVGKQLVRAVDSIAANLSEGLGRYHYRETKNFGIILAVPCSKQRLGSQKQEIGG
jgi:four helix bundle protein